MKLSSKGVLRPKIFTITFSFFFVVIIQFYIFRRFRCSFSFFNNNLSFF